MSSNDRDTERIPGPAKRRPGMHGHPHRHDDGAPHVHPHHHVGEPGTDLSHDMRAAPALHDHVHGPSFERYTWIVSPIHALDPRVKIIAATAIVVAIVLSPPPHAIELVGVATFLLGVSLLGKVPLGAVLRRSALVIPFAGAIALFAPLQQSGGSLSVGGLTGAYGDGGWIAAYTIMAKAWLATLSVAVLSMTTPVPRLFKGLESLRVPDVLLMLLAFMYRYVDVLRDQLRSLRNALDSRGFALSRWQRVRLMGNLAGNLFIRSYERGERVHAAMLSRGWTGGMPSSEQLAIGTADILAILIVATGLAALVLY